jgi:sec-independent protein translocase protein TatB
MFDIGWTELMVIAVVAVIVVGPKDLPRMLRTFGQYMGKAKSMARDLQSQFNEMAHQSELDDIRKSLDDIKDINPLKGVADKLNPMATAGEDLTKALDDLDSRTSADDPALSENYDEPAETGDGSDGKPEADGKAEPDGIPAVEESADITSEREPEDAPSRKTDKAS